VPVWRGSVLVALLAPLSACDPGWSYRVPGGTEVMENGRHFDIAGPAQTSLRVHGNLFTSTLWTIVTIKNDGTTALIIRPDEIRVSTQPGKPLPRKQPHPSRCHGHDAEAEVSLAPGDSCQIFTDFAVQPDADKLRKLELGHDGVTRDGAPVRVSVALVKD
jgi:hypothetical protein